MTGPSIPPRELTLAAQDRILILVPHPDDEVLGCGGIIQQALAMELPIRVVFLTYGDNNEWSFLIYRKRPVVLPESVRTLGLVRHDESVAASVLMGLDPGHLTFLGYPDFGTSRIWESRWGNATAYRGLLTRVRAVPYANALRPGAPYKGEEIVRDLTTVLQEFKPTKIFLSHPADQNPDHRALYLFTRIALWDLEGQMQPELCPYLIHYGRWPRAKGWQPTDPLVPPGLLRRELVWWTHGLSPDEMEIKRRALAAHRTQMSYSAKRLLPFVRPNELFGDFPAARLAPSGVALAQEHAPPSDEDLPEELTEDEQAAFVGIERRSIRLEDGALVLSLKTSRPLANTVGASVFLFGYRPDRPFAQMPKLHVKLRSTGYSVFDQTQRLPDATVRVSRHANELVLRVPLATMGNPHRVLTSARTYLGQVPLDLAAWRVIELIDAPSQ